MSRGATLVGRCPPAVQRRTTAVCHPYALLEYPVSLFRLASRLYADAADGDVLADIALIGVQGKVLRPGSPRSLDGWRFAQGRAFEDQKDIVFDRPVRFELREIREEPDRCAFRIIRRIYQAFGFLEESIPPEFDRYAGRLVLPE